MDRFDLTFEEALVLHECLRETIADLRMEISNTDSCEFREGLKRRERILKGILAQLEPPPGVEDAPPAAVHE